MTESKFKKKKLYKRLKTGWMLLPKQKTKNTTNEKKPEQHTLTFWTRAAPSPHKKKKKYPWNPGEGKTYKTGSTVPIPLSPPQSDTHSFPTSQVKQLFCVPINISISSFLADVSHVPHYLNNIRHHL